MTIVIVIIVMVKQTKVTFTHCADFVSWCMLYTHEGDKMHSSKNGAILSSVSH